MQELNDAALLIIGMQQGTDDLRLGERNNPQAEDNMRSLLQAWRSAQRPVVHVRHISRVPDSVYFPGQPGVEFQPDFHPLAGEHVLEKSLPDAFTDTGLDDWLRAHGIKHVVIAGVVTNNSIEATARNAGNLGFAAVVPADATFTFDKTDFNGVRRSAEEVHAMSLANLQGEYATVTTSAQLLAIRPISQ